MAPKGAPDSRLLHHLVKAEKAHETSFRAWTKESSSASAALSNWAVADSGDAPDVLQASLQIGAFLDSCIDSQRSYRNALSAYRTALKDVLVREREVRTIMRDREILVSRVLKLQKRRPTDINGQATADWDFKMQDAQRELGACEACLSGETKALAGVKRRIFRNALTMRMRALEQLGKAFEAAAADAIVALESLSSSEGASPIDAHFPRHDPPPPSTRAPPGSVMSAPMTGSIDPSQLLWQIPDIGEASEGSSDDSMPHDEDSTIRATEAALMRHRESTQSTVTAWAAGNPSTNVSRAPRIQPHQQQGDRPLSMPPVANVTRHTTEPGALNRAAPPDPRSPGAFAVPSAEAHRAGTGALAPSDMRDSSDDEAVRGNGHLVAKPGGGAKLSKSTRTRRLSEPTPPSQRPISASQSAGGGILSSLFGMFKRGPRREASADDSSLRRSRSSWSTRAGPEAQTQQKPRKSPHDSSDDEQPQNLIRVKNRGPPFARLQPNATVSAGGSVALRSTAAVRRGSMLSDPGPVRESLAASATVKRKKPHATVANGSSAAHSAFIEGGAGRPTRGKSVNSAKSDGTVKRKKQATKRAARPSRSAATPSPPLQPPDGGDTPSIMSLIDEAGPQAAGEGAPPLPELPPVASAETASLQSRGSDAAPSRAYQDEKPDARPASLPPGAAAVAAAAYHQPPPRHLTLPIHSALKRTSPTSLGSSSEAGVSEPSALSKRKSVRLAADSKPEAATAPPAPHPAPDTARSLTPPAPPVGWSTRTSRRNVASDDDDDDDDDDADGGAAGGSSEYARARKAMARADRRYRDAGNLEKRQARGSRRGAPRGR